MKSRNIKDSCAAHKLKTKAELLVLKRAAESPMTDEASTADMQEILHSLSVHQIELEMQNEELQLAKKKLDAVNKRYIDLYNKAPVGYITLNDAGLIQESNLMAAKLLGIDGAQLLDTTITRFIYPPDQDLYYLHQKELDETGNAQSCELRMKKKDNSTFWAHIESVTAVDTEDNHVQHVVLTDITSRIMQEDEHELTDKLIHLVNTPGDLHHRMRKLTESLQCWSGCDSVGIRLRDGEEFPYFESIGFPAAFIQKERHLCSTDSEGHIIHDNEGRPILQCLCGMVLEGHTNPEKPYFTEHGSFWSNNLLAIQEQFPVLPGQTHERTCFNDRHYHSMALVPLHSGGTTFGLLQFNDHRTNRFNIELIKHFEHMADKLAIALSQRQAEASLRESQMVFQQLFDNMANGVIVCRENSEAASFDVVDINRPGLTMAQCQRADAVDHSIADVLPGKGTATQAALLEMMRIVAASGTPAATAMIERTANQSIRWWLDVFIYKLPSELLVLIYSDITAQKQTMEEKEQLEKQLQQSQKMEPIGRLAGGVAHDFNNMLGVILGHLELAFDLAGPAHPLYKNLKQIQTAAKRSAKLAAQLLAFARKQPSTPTVLDMNKAVNSMLNMMRRLIGENITLEWHPNDLILPVKMDPTQLDQILANLCVNACDAIKDIGTITIEVSERTIDENDCIKHSGMTPGKYVAMSISDDGCGMTDEVKNQIFEPFYTTKEVGKGTGLGLSTVYGIMKQHGGYIDVQSKLGQGSTFTIFIPCHESHPVKQVENDSEPAKPGNACILLVEDEPGLRELLKLILQSLGYSVIAAGSPIKALEIATQRGEEIDALLTDVIMPEMNGRDLADHIQTLHPGMKCLFMSGYADGIIAQHGILKECTHFLHKPFSKKELSEKLKSIMT